MRFLLQILSLLLFGYFLLLSPELSAQNRINEKVFGFLAEKQLLATVNERYEVEIWNARTGDHLNQFDFDATDELRFSPNGEYLIALSNNKIVIWSLQENRILQTIQSDGFGYSLDITDNSKFLLYTVQNECFIWSLDANSIYQKRKSKEYIEYAHFAGNDEVICINDYQEVEIWDLNSGKKQRTFYGSGDSPEIHLVNNDNILLFEDFDALYFYNLETGKFIDSLEIPEDYYGISNDRMIFNKEDSFYAYDPVTKEYTPYQPFRHVISVYGKRLEVLEVYEGGLKTISEITLEQKRNKRITPTLILPNTELSDYKYGSILLKGDFEVYYTADYTLALLRDNYGLILDFMIYDHFRQLLVDAGNLNLKKYLPTDTEAGQIDWVEFYQSGDTAFITAYTDKHEKLEYNHLKQNVRFMDHSSWDYEEQEDMLVATDVRDLELEGYRRTVSVLNSDGDTLWTSPKIPVGCNEKMYLINNTTILTSIPYDSVRYQQMLYWYDFVNDKIVFSSNNFQLVEQNLVQHNEHAKVNFKHFTGTKFKNQENSYVYINLATGTVKQEKDSTQFSLYEKRMIDTLSHYPIDFKGVEKMEYSGFFDVYKLDKWIKQGKLGTVMSEEFTAPYISSGYDILYAPNYPNYINYVKNNKVTFHSGSNTGFYVDPSSYIMSFWNGDLQGAPKIVHLVVNASGEHLFFTEDGYYYGSQNLVKAFSFKYNGNVYPFTQFDLQFNRPDVILSRLGYASKDQIAMFEKAYRKRLSKVGMIDLLDINADLPTVEIKYKSDLPAETDASAIELKIELNDLENTLDHLHIWVNNVPVYGTKGIDISEYHTKTLDTSFIVYLNSGFNLVEVAATNSAGVESIKETVRIRSNQQDPTVNLYFIGIGVKDYMDASMNLSFSDKDIRDVAKIFAQSKSYGAVFIDTFLNERATIDILSQLKNRLTGSTIHDEVILMYSGHGLLDQELNYYLSTYDVNFSQPEERGLRYDHVNDLLDGIPARKKLILLDACHSGELDKDEAEFTASTVELKEKDFSKASLKSVIASTGNSFELMQELFADLRRGTGATVISSSSGKYYSYEDATHQNGIYTFALKEGLEGAADMNHDEEISVSELKTFLYQRVSELTKGKQKPTTREENLEFDFRVY